MKSKSSMSGARVAFTLSRSANIPPFPRPVRHRRDPADVPGLRDPLGGRGQVEPGVAQAARRHGGGVHQGEAGGAGKEKERPYQTVM